MLLIITNRQDLACDYLIVRLRDRNIPFARFNTDQYPEEISFDICFNKNKLDYTIWLEKGKEIKRQTISSVYFRQPVSPTFEAALNLTEKNFAEAELTEALRSLWRVIPEHLWLNHPKRLWIASNKVEQLLIAKKVGFRIPDTLISLSRNSINAFFSKTESHVIAKAVRHGFVNHEDKVLLAGTQRLSDDFITHFESYATVPMTYQFEVEGGLDIRVVVVGKQLFATAISLEERSELSIDWRVSEIEGSKLKHDRIDLPDTVSEQCFAIVRSFGLNYSSIDLIKDQNGNYFFLELNPNGQWAWIEQITRYRIRDSIIDTLMES